MVERRNAGTYLMERREAVHVRRVDVGAHLQQPLHLILVARRARRQEHDP